MLDILHFVFSDFWIWLGTVVLVSVAGSAISQIIMAISLLWRGPK